MIWEKQDAKGISKPENGFEGKYLEDLYINTFVKKSEGSLSTIQFTSSAYGS